jgi:hypothetical protein
MILYLQFFIGKMFSRQKLPEMLSSLKEPIPKIQNKYLQKRNCAAWVPISTPHSCVCERFIHTTVSLPILLQDRSWEFINRSQIHKCGNWDWGYAIPRKEYINGIFVAVWELANMLKIFGLDLNDTYPYSRIINDVIRLPFHLLFTLWLHGL